MIQNMSREDAEAFEPPGENWACVSISQPGEPARLSRAFQATLRVAFSDWDCDRYGKLPPERMNPALIHYFTEKQARAIASFLTVVVENGWDLVVHCDAGVSRSAAVVEAALRAYPEHFTDLGGARFSNSYVRRLLLRELGIVPMGVIIS